MSFRKQDRKTWFTVKSVIRLLPTLLLTAIILFAAPFSEGKRKKKARPVRLSQEQEANIAEKPSGLQPLYRKVVAEGQRDFVLNHMNAGLAAFGEGHFDLAEESFEAALVRIETTHANTEAVIKARSLWHEEGAKDFKGEPYERSMAYYYRGLLAMRKADYEYARACFLSGSFQDAFAEEHQYRSDFALMMYLAAWASHLNHDYDYVADYLYETTEIRPGCPYPGEADRLLIIAETGRAPRKLADGVGHYQLKFFRGKNFSENIATVRIGDFSKVLYPIEDIFWQARTRGGRRIDKILKEKVVFLEYTQYTGTTLTGTARVALTASALINSLEKYYKRYKTKPLANWQETRYWRNLPDAVHILPISKSEIVADVSVDFYDALGNVVGTQTISRLDCLKADGFLWFRSHSPLTEILPEP